MLNTKVIKGKTLKSPLNPEITTTHQTKLTREKGADNFLDDRETERRVC